MPAVRTGDQTIAALVDQRALACASRGRFLLPLAASARCERVEGGRAVLRVVIADVVVAEVTVGSTKVRRRL